MLQFLFFEYSVRARCTKLTGDGLKTTRKNRAPEASPLIIITVTIVWSRSCCLDRVPWYLAFTVPPLPQSGQIRNPKSPQLTTPKCRQPASGSSQPYGTSTGQE